MAPQQPGEVAPTEAALEKDTQPVASISQGDWKGRPRVSSPEVQYLGISRRIC